MKGIILAGGHGTRLEPLTSVNSKQLLPIYNKPLIYYPLSSFMLASIREILIISTPNDTPQIQKLFGDGANFGLNISYEIQSAPKGIADAFLVGASFIKDSPVALILGDNLFYGNDFKNLFLKSIKNNRGATIFTQKVNDPERFGVLSVSKSGKILSIEEKPKKPKSNLAVTGLYIYDNNVVNIVKNLKPSARNELEITDVNNIYLKNNIIDNFTFGRGTIWFDAGTPDSLNDASCFVRMVEKKSSELIGSPEEIAWRNNWIDNDQLIYQCKKFEKSEYGKSLYKLLKDT